MSLRQVVTFRNFTIAVGLCLIASVCLALAPLIDAQVPLYPFVGANWVLWMILVLVFRPSKADSVTHAESIWWDRLTSLAMVAFTASGFFALSRAETLICAGDLTQVR